MAPEIPRPATRAPWASSSRTRRRRSFRTTHSSRATPARTRSRSRWRPPARTTPPLTHSLLRQTVTFAAPVSPVARGAGTPTGTATFEDAATAIGTGTLSGGIATFSTTTLAVGSHTITAVYGGDTTYLGSSSTTLDQLVNSLGTTTAATNATAAYGDASVSLTATTTSTSTVNQGAVTFTVKR